jgi:hypothetical protein
LARFHIQLETLLRFKDSSGKAFAMDVVNTLHSPRSRNEKDTARTWIATLAMCSRRRSSACSAWKKARTFLDPGHDKDLVGWTDILILSDLAKQFPHYVELLPEVKMLIEVKKVVKAGSGFQALLELIALDFLVDDPV